MQKAASFWTFSKSGLNPPPSAVLDAHDVTFFSRRFWKNKPPKTTSQPPKKCIKATSKLAQNYLKTFWKRFNLPPLTSVMSKTTSKLPQNYLKTTSKLPQNFWNMFSPTYCPKVSPQKKLPLIFGFGFCIGCLP